MRRIAMLVVVLVIAGCARYLPPRVEAPIGRPAQIGVSYGMSVSCAIPFKLGGLWWTFDEPMPEWPPDISIPPFPFSIWATYGTPYAVPGVVTLTSPTTATYRADVDGTEFQLTGTQMNPTPGNACV